MTVAGIARKLGASPKEVREHLEHLLRSLERSDYEAVVTPAACRKCGFTFDERKLSKPGRCPECKGGWIRAAELELKKIQHS